MISLTPIQKAVYDALTGVFQPTRDLCRVTGIKHGSVEHALRALEKRGLIERTMTHEAGRWPGMTHPSRAWRLLGDKQKVITGAGGKRAAVALISDKPFVPTHVHETVWRMHAEERLTDAKIADRLRIKQSEVIGLRKDMAAYMGAQAGRAA